MQRKGSTPPKILLRAISRLRKQQDIVISRSDKGSGVIILDKSQYLELLKKSSVNLTDKFAPVSLERSKTRGRPPKQYHPHLQREKDKVAWKIKKILPKSIADQLCPNGS